MGIASPESGNQSLTAAVFIGDEERSSNRMRLRYDYSGVQSSRLRFRPRRKASR
ncbi:hypothetical protein LINGRAHAP2_LOCUS4418 [Linum grandiflorum]